MVGISGVRMVSSGGAGGNSDCVDESAWVTASDNDINRTDVTLSTDNRSS